MPAGSGGKPLPGERQLFAAAVPPNARACPAPPPCSIQLIPAADGFDQTSASKATEHLPRIQAELGVAYDDM